MEVKQFSEEDKAKFREEYPAAEPKGWAVVEPGESGVIGFYATEREAREALNKMELGETIHDLFRDWVLLTARDLNIDPVLVRSAVRELM